MTKPITTVKSTLRLPQIVAVAGERAIILYTDFFASNIRNEHTKRAYGGAIADFLDWCGDAGIASINDVRPPNVAAWIDLQAIKCAAPTVRLKLAALRHLFDWLSKRQVIPTNPTASIHRSTLPAADKRKGSPRALSACEARALLEKININTSIGLRDRALIAVMIYSFARIGTALAMQMDDVFLKEQRLWIRLQVRGKPHEMPCHPQLEVYLRAYIKHLLMQIQKAGLSADPRHPLFRTIGRRTGRLTQTHLLQPNAFARVRHWAEVAGIDTQINNHSFRAVGIATYLENGGTLANAAAIANHVNINTTRLYDRRRDEASLENEISPDELDRITL